MHRNLQTKSRILGLDIVRASAILLVLIAHFLNIWHFGVIGVELFFVLSGFLIGQILCKEVVRTNFALDDVWNFWRRRWYRTLPNYLACLFVLIIAGHALHTRFSAPLWPYLLFVQNIAPHQQVDFFPTSWSLSVEEWSYLILPIAILCALLIEPGRRKRCILIGAIAIVVLPTLFRCGMGPSGAWDSVIRKAVMLRMDAIGYGVLLAYASMYRADMMARLKSPAFATVGAFCIMVLYVNLGHQAEGPRGPMLWRNGLWLTASSISIMPIIAYSSTIVSSRVWLIRTLAPIVSTYSYSLYLWHLLVMMVVDNYWHLYHGPLNRIVELCVYVGGSGLLAWVAYHVVEKPFMDMRSRGTGLTKARVPSPQTTILVKRAS